jgi:hypothetical protein
MGEAIKALRAEYLSARSAGVCDGVVLCLGLPDRLLGYDTVKSGHQLVNLETGKTLDGIIRSVTPRSIDEPIVLILCTQENRTCQHLQDSSNAGIALTHLDQFRIVPSSRSFKRTHGDGVLEKSRSSFTSVGDSL